MDAPYPRRELPRWRLSRASALGKVERRHSHWIAHAGFRVAFATILPPIFTLITSIMLVSPIASRLSSRYVCAQCRAFSSSRRSLVEAQAAEVNRLGVVGAGQMGLGIALVASRMAKVPVVVVDNSQKSLDKGLAFAGEHYRTTLR